MMCCIVLFLFLRKTGVKFVNFLLISDFFTFLSLQDGEFRVQ